MDYTSKTGMATLCRGDAELFTCPVERRTYADGRIELYNNGAPMSLQRLAVALIRECSYHPDEVMAALDISEQDRALVLKEAHKPCP